jgi:Tfp pilus assembly protein PilX
MKAKLLTHKQQGAATLFTALVLLISITLVLLLTSKTVLVETQITADNYRTSQAAAAASAAMDQAVAYFNAGGLDQHNNTTPATLTADGLVDYIGPGNNFYNGALNVTAASEPSATSCSMPATTAFPLALTSGAQTTYAQFYFNNTDDNACDCQSTLTENVDGDTDGDCLGTAGTNMTRALVTAKGWSDDCTAVRTITQCVGTFDIFDAGSGPQQPFISRAGVGVFGNAKIINRYNNSSIWSGGADAVHGAAYGTYLRPSGTESADYTTAQLDSSCEASPCNDASNPGPNDQLVSNRNAGNGIDVITNDPTLAGKTSSTAAANMTSTANNQFFDMFFAHTKAEIKNAANDAGQMLSGTSPVGLTGLIWEEGNLALHNGDVVGSPTNPAILIVNGDLDLTGGPIYGVIYVTGQLTITGNPVVKGSIVAENSALPPNGAGTLTLVYKPWSSDGNQAPPFSPGTGAVIAGSWKDW